ncbi:MAG: leucine-rich repeat domain-containing protein [Clostridia bacterium]|nr:leucine-rich repeat domain-containing protein [Clostridia bacterium]
MKKKIFLMLAAATMLIFAFTLAISAATYICVDEETNEELFRYEIASGKYPITSYSGAGFAKYDDEGDALTWYRTGTSTLETGEMQYTVASAKTKTLVKDNGDGILQSSEITNYGKLMSITFDKDCGITEFGTNDSNSGLFHKTSNMEIFLFVDIPDSVTKLNDYCFRNCICLLNVGISENSKLTDLGSASFFGATSLRSIYIPKGVTVLKTQFTSDTYWENGLFRNCQRLETVTFAEDSCLEVLEKGTFNYCNSLKAITLPNSVKTIQPRVFAHCPELEYINFGGGLEEIVRIENDSDEYVSLFQYTTKLKTVVLPATFKAENLADNLHTTFAITGITIHYAGTEEEFVKLQEKFAKATLGSGNKGITGATYNYISPCDAFYGGEHNIQTIIEYANFLSSGYKSEGCIIEGCKINDKTEVPALFTCLGYSAPENGKGGIAIGFTVNSAAIAEYKKVTGKTLSYGIFAALKDSLNGSDIFVDGEANECAIVVDMTKYATAAFEIKIVGFENDDQKTAQIAMGAYVKVDNDYSYMQNSTPDENEKYCFDSFNEIVDSLSN